MRAHTAKDMHLIERDNKSVRFCIDYRQLNAITMKDLHALPRINDSLGSLRGS